MLSNKQLHTHVVKKMNTQGPMKEFKSDSEFHCCLCLVTQLKLLNASWFNSKHQTLAKPRRKKQRGEDKGRAQDYKCPKKLPKLQKWIADTPESKIKVTITF